MQDQTRHFDGFCALHSGKESPFMVQLLAFFQAAYAKLQGWKTYAAGTAVVLTQAAGFFDMVPVAQAHAVSLFLMGFAVIFQREATAGHSLDLKQDLATARTPTPPLKPPFPANPPPTLPHTLPI